MGRTPLHLYSLKNCKSLKEQMTLEKELFAS